MSLALVQPPVTGATGLTGAAGGVGPHGPGVRMVPFSFTPTSSPNLISIPAGKTAVAVVVTSSTDLRLFAGALELYSWAGAGSLALITTRATVTCGPSTNSSNASISIMMGEVVVAYPIPNAVRTATQMANAVYDILMAAGAVTDRYTLTSPGAGTSFTITSTLCGFQLVVSGNTIDTITCVHDRIGTLPEYSLECPSDESAEGYILIAEAEDVDPLEPPPDAWVHGEVFGPAEDLVEGNFYIDHAPREMQILAVRVTVEEIDTGSRPVSFNIYSTSRGLDMLSSPQALGSDTQVWTVDNGWAEVAGVTAGERLEIRLTTTPGSFASEPKGLRLSFLGSYLP